MIWYVDPKTGNDSNGGRSPEQAFKTMTRAVTAASAGDTVLLIPGAYDLDLPEQVGAARVAGLTIGVVGAD